MLKSIVSFGTKMKDVEIDKVYIDKFVPAMPLRMAGAYTGNPIEFDAYERPADYLENVKFTNVINEYGKPSIALKEGNKNDITLNGEKI